LAKSVTKPVGKNQFGFVLGMLANVEVKALRGCLCAIGPFPARALFTIEFLFSRGLGDVISARPVGTR
jgi:hypothetical protein